MFVQQTLKALLRVAMGRIRSNCKRIGDTATEAFSNTSLCPNGFLPVAVLDDIYTDHISPFRAAQKGEQNDKRSL